MWTACAFRLMLVCEVAVWVHPGGEEGRRRQCHYWAKASTSCKGGTRHETDKSYAITRIVNMTANPLRCFGRSDAINEVSLSLFSKSQGLGEFNGHWEEIPVLPTGKGVPETRPSSSKEQQAAGSEVLPVEDRPLSHWPVPQVEEEQAHGQVLVVPILDPDPGASFQELPLHRKAQQKILWAEVWKETGRGKIG